MKTIKLLLAIVTATTLNLKFGNLNCKAQTSVPAGNVSGTWTLGGSPYNVQGNIQILDGATLTIQPGVTVNFTGGFKLEVQGRLLAIGTPNDTIIFSASNISNGWRSIRFDNTPNTNDSSKLKYCKLEYGKAIGSPPNDGGALYFNNFSKAIISNSHILNCYAMTGGGIFCYNNSKPIISDNNISNNTAYNSGSAIGCLNNSMATITNNNISNNTISGNGGAGGGIYLSGSSSTISNNTISNNIVSSGNGGGIYCYGSNPFISNNIISTNTSTNGGGIYCTTSSSPVIINNTISNNTTTYIGGGIYCDMASNPAISNNKISNNTGPMCGGIFCDNSSPLITNNEISNNSAQGWGGGIRCDFNGNPSIMNNTIANNSASHGGALYCDHNSNPVLRNNILWGNIASSSGAQVRLNDESSDPFFYHCDVQGGSGAFELNGNSFTGSYQNNINTDPLFISPSGGSGTGFNGVTADWSLQSNSPCVNTGDPVGTYPEMDKAGNTRVTVCRIDMGAYEYQNGIPFTASISQTQQILCYGDSTASATIIVAGGIPTYTYLWSNGETTATATILKAGTYTVTVTETSYACSITKTITINQPSATLSLIPATTNPICTNNNGSAAITVNGGTAPYTYLWSTNNNSATYTISGCLAGTYSVTVTDTNGCSVLDSVTLFTQFPSLSVVSSSINPICTNNNGSANITANGGTSPYTYLWSTNNNSTTDTISSLLAGTYSVTVTDTNGCSILDSVILVTQFPSLSLVSSVTNASCYNNDGSTNVIPSGGTAPYSYFWSNNSISQNLSNIGSGTYSVAVTDTNGCAVSEALTINNSIAPISIPICMVTVDTSSTKNVIVWEKPISALIDSFKVYREVSSVYSHVGSVHYNDVSEFIDNASGINPNTTSYKYKLSLLDTCGNESLLSTEHRTIHVQLSLAFPQGVNLNWNDYLGFSFSQYRILRDDLGNGNWQAIDSVSFGTTTYTSTDVLPNAGYIVEATRPTACVSTRQSGTTRNSSKSNTASQTTGVNELLSDLTLIISPNPSNGKFTIELSSSGVSNNNKYVIKIYNVLGEQIYLSELKQLTRNEIDLSNVPKGIYFVNVYNEDKIYTSKIVKQ
ncbi:MAG: right-handed parallel beta-helix repeat-containing protein [Bacteroidota bacterium]